jgi:hypothetical protein
MFCTCRLRGRPRGSCSLGLPTDSLIEITRQQRWKRGTSRAREMSSSLWCGPGQRSSRFFHLTRAPGWKQKLLHRSSLLGPIQKDPSQEEGARGLRQNGGFLRNGTGQRLPVETRLAYPVTSLTEIRSASTSERRDQEKPRSRYRYIPINSLVF